MPVYYSKLDGNATQKNTPDVFSCSVHQGTRRKPSIVGVWKSLLPSLLQLLTSYTTRYNPVPCQDNWSQYISEMDHIAYNNGHA
jgi:hypothetical protein